MSIVNLSGRTVEIDLYEVLRCIPTGQKMELIEALSIEDDVIDAVTDQIIEGSTESGSCGGRAYPAPREGATGLDRAIMLIVQRHDEVAAKEMRILHARLLAMDESRNAALSENVQLGRALRDAKRRIRELEAR